MIQLFSTQLLLSYKSCSRLSGSASAFIGRMRFEVGILSSVVDRIMAPIDVARRKRMKLMARNAHPTNPSVAGLPCKAKLGHAQGIKREASSHNPPSLNSPT